MIFMVNEFYVQIFIIKENLNLLNYFDYMIVMLVVTALVGYIEKNTFK